jgi:hypothetical protein
VRFELEPSLAVLREYRANCRYRRPVIVDLLKKMGEATFGTPSEKGEDDAKKILRMLEETDREIEREQRVAESVHIPQIVRLGREEVRRRRDALLAKMTESQRNKAGAPTWDQLASMEGDGARIRCWRYWILTEQFEAYEPEVAYT